MPNKHQRSTKLLVHARVRFFWLLLCLLGVILVAPALPDSVGGEWEGAALSVSIFLAASYVSRGWQSFWIMGILGLIMVAAFGTDLFTHDSTISRFVLFLVVLIMLAHTSVTVLTYVLDSGQVGAEHIYAAICAYVLIAMAFATLDFMLESLAPGSFSGVHAQSMMDRPWWQFFYFSFTTQSTVGYGDIVPVTMRARSFVMIQQLVAVFYVAILIARLTGMYDSGKKSAESQSLPPAS